MLNELDERLDGLTMLLETFQVSNGSHALVALGVIQPDVAAVGGRATIANLWQLAREAAAQPEVSCLHPGGFGHDAFQVIYGKTALLAWVAGDRLMTISVTDLRGDTHHIVRVAQTIAASTAEYLTRKMRPAHATGWCHLSQTRIWSSAPGDSDRGRPAARASP